VPPSKRNPLEDHVLSLACSGELSKTLRLIADKIDSGEANAATFTVKVSADVMELAALLHLRGGPKHGRT